MESTDDKVQDAPLLDEKENESNDLASPASNCSKKSNSNDAHSKEDDASSESSSNSSSDDESSDEDSVEDPHLSEYGEFFSNYIAFLKQ